MSLKLCVYQRVPYLITIIFTFLGISYPKYNLVIRFTINFLFKFNNIWISCWYRKEIFKEFSGCILDSINIIDKNELLKLLNSK